MSFGWLVWQTLIWPLGSCVDVFKHLYPFTDKHSWFSSTLETWSSYNINTIYDQQFNQRNMMSDRERWGLLLASFISPNKWPIHWSQLLTVSTRRCHLLLRQSTCRSRYSPPLLCLNSSTHSRQFSPHCHSLPFHHATPLVPPYTAPVKGSASSMFPLVVFDTRGPILLYRHFFLSPDHFLCLISPTI